MINPAAIEPVDLPDIDEMPEYKRIALAKWVIEVTTELFKQPGVEEEYQAWLAKREAGKKQLQEEQ